MAKANVQKPEAASREAPVQCAYCLKSTSIVPAEDYRPIYVHGGVCGKRFIAQRVQGGIDAMKVEAAPALDNPDRREIELSLGDEEVPPAAWPWRIFSCAGGGKLSILNDLMSTLDFCTPVEDIRLGIFHTAVVTRRCGLAASLPRDALRQPPPLVREPGFLGEQSAEELARLAHSDSILEAAVGMATINSLICVDPEACRELNAAELILQKGEGRNVAVVGHFPFLPRVRAKARRLWVIEKNFKEGDFPEYAADALIPQAEVVGITGTALTNHTLEHLLALCSPSAYVVLMGDTAPLSPLFFEYGVDAVCGTVVIDSRLSLRCVSQGATFRQIKGTKRLTLQKRPGQRPC